MFRRFFSDKKKPEPTWKFGVSLDKSAIWVKSEEWTKEIQQFEELRRDFRSLLVFEDIDLFTKIVPIGKVDEQIARNMLPENQTRYLNIMGCIRFIRLHGVTQKQLGKVAIELFEKVVQMDGDLVDDIVEVIENNSFSSQDVTHERSLFNTASRGMIESTMINHGILEEGGNAVEKVRIAKANGEVSKKIQALFTIIKRIAFIEDGLS